MNFVNEPEFLQNLRCRYEKGFPYTYADNIVVSWYLFGFKKKIILFFVFSGIRHKDDIASMRDLNEYKMAILNS